MGSYEGIPVIAPATHDTGSAVAAVPATGRDYAYISSGTWSLAGVEVDDAIIDEAAYAANVTNEGGVEGTYRLLKNVMGLWILQQCRATWEHEGASYSYAEMVDLARAAQPSAAIFDVDDPRFLPHGDHPQRIRDWCAEHGVTPPQTHGEIVRCVLESLALKYRLTFDNLRQISGQPIKAIHIVGGGGQNELLNQFTADAAGIPVVTGPIEATVLGNAAVQLIALGELGSVSEARQIIADMGITRTYRPRSSAWWDEAYQKLLEDF